MVILFLSIYTYKISITHAIFRSKALNLAPSLYAIRFMINCENLVIRPWVESREEWVKK